MTVELCFCSACYAFDQIGSFNLHFISYIMNAATARVGVMLVRATTQVGGMLPL